MRTDEKVDREVKALADIINRQLEGQRLLVPGGPNAAARIALAVYAALRWSRGRREMAPTEFVRKVFEATDWDAAPLQSSPHEQQAPSGTQGYPPLVRRLDVIRSRLRSGGEHQRSEKKAE